MNARGKIPQQRTRAGAGRSMLGTVSTLSVVLAMAFCSQVAVADVGDQYLPEIPDSGAKKGEDGSGSSDAQGEPAGSGSQATSQGKAVEKPDSKEDRSGLAVSGTPGGGDGGPGTGAVIGLVILALAMVGGVLWLVLRGQSALADAEQGSKASGKASPTPKGGITGRPSGKPGKKR